MDAWEIVFKFTETYRKYEHENPALREMMCLRAMFPYAFNEIKDDDIFAGRVQLLSVGFRLDENGHTGYYCREKALQKAFESETNEERRKKFKDLIDFWSERTTLKHALALEPVDFEEGLRKGAFAIEAENLISHKPWETLVVYPFVSYSHRWSAINMDFDKLMTLGIPGLKAEIESHLKSDKLSEDSSILYKSMLGCLEIFEESCRYYADMVRTKAAVAANAKREKELLRMASALDKIAVGKPGNFYEAAQLFWLYKQLANIGGGDYGRMDVYLGDFYANDIDLGRISEEDALEILKGLWRIIAATASTWTGRVVIGGLGRRNEKNADRFALAAMQATKETPELLPQLSLRVYRGMNPELMKKALDVIAVGHVFPMLYNDDVLVKSVKSSLGVSAEDALQYVSSDCGEYGVFHKSISSPNTSINFAKIINLVIHNGCAHENGQRVGLLTGDFAEFKSFEDFWTAWTVQVEYFLKTIARYHAAHFKALRNDARCLFISMLYDDCISRGKGIFDGGAVYAGTMEEIYGVITAADSMLVIKELVYDKKRISPERLLVALDNNFAGYERERAMCLQVPKYGNDNKKADDMALRVYKYICDAVAAVKPEGFDFHLADLINASGHVTGGKYTEATPDGRLAGEPLPNANNPTIGQDKNGVTALLNSLAVLEPSKIGGQSQYVKFSKRMMNEHRAEVAAAIDTYFTKGGSQLMITVTDREELEDALKNPEKHQNLIVRIGGFNARFVQIDKDLQMEVLNRTTY